MVFTDPIADMLSRIRNAIMVDKTTVAVPHSKLKETIARQLQKLNFVDSVKIEGDGIAKTIQIGINEQGTNARITVIEKVSKPGRRVYAKSDEIPKFKNGRGVIIVSTSQGLMTGREAKKNRIGGELICRVY